jgi:hypothetical protein
MKGSAAVALLSAVVLFASATASNAQHAGGHGGGGYHGGHDGGVRSEVFIGPGWGYPYGYPYWPYPYYVPPPPYYGYPPPPSYDDGQAQEYMQQEPAPSQGYWYYCASSKAYYPQVQSCREEWIKVPPRPAN